MKLQSGFWLIDKIEFMKIYNSIYISFIIICCFFLVSYGFSGNSINDVKLIEKPRVIIDIQEEINGIKDEKSASNWVKERSANYGIRVVEAERAGALAAKRADLLGRNNEASLRKEGIISNYDYFIQGKVSGHQEKEKGLYDSKDGIRFSLGMDMSVIEAATGEVIATTVIPPQDILVRNVVSEQAATREAINRLMKGSEESIGADELFRKMESHWISEKHLGELYCLEFVGFDLVKANLLKIALFSFSGINEPRVCSVDAAGISVLECQTKLKSLDLASLVQKTITGFKLDRSDAHYLSFRENGEEVKVLNIPNKITSVNFSQENFFEKYWQAVLIALLTPSTLSVRRIRVSVWNFLKILPITISGLIRIIIKKIKRNEDV